MKRRSTQLTLLILALFSASLFAAEVGDMRGEDLQQVERRYEARAFDNFSFGPAKLFNSNSHGIAYQFSYGRLWEPHPNAGLLFRADWIADFNDLAGMWDFAIGGRYYFSRTAVSPFVQGDFGLGIADEFGFQLGASAGVVFFRTSSINLVVEPNIQWLLTEASPLGMGIKIGLYFKPLPIFMIF